MAKCIPGFDGFSEPETNYTKLPNEFFDKVLAYLKPPEVKALLFIIRQTWGWQRMFTRIAISQFTKRLRMSKNTVLKALDSLEECHCILRYRTGRGSTRETFFFVYTPTTCRVAQSLREGHFTIKQLETIQRGYLHDGARLAPSVDNELGANPDPKLGAPPAPSSPAILGARTEPSRKRTKKQEQKKVDSPLLGRKSLETDIEPAAPSEQRSRNGPTGFSALGDLVKQLLRK